MRSADEYAEKANVNWIQKNENKIKFYKKYENNGSEKYKMYFHNIPRSLYTSHILHGHYNVRHEGCNDEGRV